MVEQLALVVAGPSDVAVGAEEHGGYLEFVAPADAECTSEVVTQTVSVDSGIDRLTGGASAAVESKITRGNDIIAQQHTSIVVK